MKRYLSLLIALVMVFGLVSVHADGSKNLSEDEAGKKLKDWGALKGSKDGNLMKDEGLKREDAVLILIRMMGKEAEAEATPTLPGFKDIKDRYYHPYIAFAQAQGWTEGRNKDEFGYGDYVTGDEFTALMLRALGYDYKGKLYSKVGDKAKELGLLNGVNMDKASKFRRGSAFVMMFNTLQQPKKDGEHKLSQVLGYEKKPEPVVFRLEEARAKGLREIELSFTKPLAPVGEKHFKLSEGKHIVDIKDVRLMGENNKLSLLLEKPVKNDAKLKLEIIGLKSEDLSETYKGSVDVEMFDNERPVVTELNAMGPKLFLFKTSEALSLETKASFTSRSEILIDGKQEKMRLDYNHRDEVVVELYTPLKAGSHEIEVAGFRDYAGYSIEASSFQVEVEDDNRAPELENVTLIASDKIKLSFNEPLYDKGEFKVNDSSSVSSTATLDKEDRRIVYLKLSRPLKSRVVLINYHNQRDVMRNKIKDVQTYTLELDDDSTPPTVLKAQVEKIELIVQFSEAMNKYAGSYTIKQGAKTIKKVNNLNTNSWLDEDILKIDISNLSGDITKPYTLILEGFKDAGINGIELAKYETTFIAVDTKQPTAEGAYRIVEYYDQGKKFFKEISIHFSEEMDKTTIEDARNYTFKSYFDGKSTKKVRGDQADFSFTATADGKSVIIRVMEQKAWIDGVIELTGQKDLAGNYLSTKQVTNYSGEVNKLVRAIMTGQPGDVKVEVEFHNPVEIIGNEALILVDDAGRELSLSLVSNEGTKAAFDVSGSATTLDNDARTPDGRRFSVKVLDGSEALDVYGTQLKKNSTVNLEDKVVPVAEIDSIEVLSNRRINLLFSEPMEKNGFIVKLLKEEGGVATYTENGEEKINTIVYHDDSSPLGERKARKVSFQTAGPMEKGSYKLVIAQAKDKNDNFLNDGYELQIDFYVEK